MLECDLMVYSFRRAVLSRRRSGLRPPSSLLRTFRRRMALIQECSRLWAMVILLLGSLTSSRRMKSLASSLVLLKYSSSKS